MTTKLDFSQMLDKIKETGGTFRMGNSWDSVFYDKGSEKVAKEVYDLLETNGLNVYNFTLYKDGGAMFNYN